jgi:hypothetical protein
MLHCVWCAVETASFYSLCWKRCTSIVSVFYARKSASCPGIFRLDIINYVTMETDRPNLILPSLNGYSLTVHSYKVNVAMETFWQVEVPSDNKKLDQRPDLTCDLTKGVSLLQYSIVTPCIASWNNRNCVISLPIASYIHVTCLTLAETTQICPIWEPIKRP